jgi:preprotein translocase subunit SecG
MYTVLIFIFVIVASLMTLAILMQSSKGGGLAASFGTLGGMGGVLGPRGAANFLQKATTILAILYGATCLLIGFIGRPTGADSGSVIQRELQRQQQQQSGIPLPVAPTEEPSQLPPEQPPASDQQNPSSNPQ